LDSRDDAGLRRLAAAVLRQAVADVSQGSTSECRQTCAWLNGETDEGLSFDLCCRLLGCKPGDMRRRVIHDAFATTPANLALAAIATEYQFPQSA
jgi:hypothetical protein